MKNEPVRSSDLITAASAWRLDKEFEEFGTGAEIDDETKQRILSLVMRKAGYEMKETMVNKKRHSKRFMGIIIAAAVLTAGAAGVGAYAYNKGIFDFSKAVYDSDDLETLKSIEQVEGTGGSCLENSFDELDIRLETTLNMSDMTVAVFTLSKKDGSAFEAVEGYRYNAGIAASELFIGGVAYGGYEHENSQAYLNDDGTLTLVAGCSGIDLSGSTHSSEKCACMIKLTDLYLTPDLDYWNKNGGGEEYIKAENRLQELSIELQNQYFTETFDIFGDEGLTEDELYRAEDLSDDYYKMLENYLEAKRELSKDSCFGTAVFKIEDMSDRSLHGSSEGIDITANPFSIKAAGKGDPRELFKDHTPNFELHMILGEVIKLPVDKNHIAWSSGTNGYIWDHEHLFEDRPINVSQIDYVVFDGVRIELS